MLKRTKQKLAVILFTSALFINCFTGTAYAKITSSSHLDYVALGDSLAAGQTPNYVTKTNTGYTDIIADKLDKAGIKGDFTNFGVSGYKTSDVLSNLPNQLEVIKKAEIITIDIGANDVLAYLPALMKGDPSALPNINTAITQTVPNNLTSIISEIKNVNKKAKIYVMGYYNGFPQFPATQQKVLIGIIQSLNASIYNVTGACDTVYVDTFTSMDNPNDPNDQTVNVPISNDIHPSVTGYNVIANSFWNFISSDFVKTQNKCN